MGVCSAGRVPPQGRGGTCHGGVARTGLGSQRGSQAWFFLQGLGRAGHSHPQVPMVDMLCTLGMWWHVLGRALQKWRRRRRSQRVTFRTGRCRDWCTHTRGAMVQGPASGEGVSRYVSGALGGRGEQSVFGGGRPPLMLFRKRICSKNSSGSGRRISLMGGSASSSQKASTSAISFTKFHRPQGRGVGRASTCDASGRTF